MNLSVTINHQQREIEIQPNETLLRALRRNGYFGVKHGCENGECDGNVERKVNHVNR